MIPQFLRQPNEPTGIKRKKQIRFVSKTLFNLAHVVTLTLSRFYLSNRKGVLQQTPVLVKAVALILFPLAITGVHHISTQIIILGFILSLSLLSQVSYLKLVRQTSFFVLFFGLLVSFPASLNIFNDGKIIFSLISFEHPTRWWIYNIPDEIGITREGLEFVFRICLKIFNSVSFVLLILSTTGFENVVKGLRYLRVPQIFLLVLTLAYKFIVILSQSLYQSFQAMRLRWWNRASSPLEKEIASGRIGFLFRKAWENYELTYKAMIARGFSGEYRLLNPQPLSPADFWMVIGLIIFTGSIIFFDSYGPAF